MQYRIVLPTILVLALFACARQSAPTGGEKDTTPPGIDTLGSTPNFSTRFNPRKIELKFDEWVTLSEAAAQVVVSPPLAKRPEVTLRGKKVIVQFDKNERFRDSTTYTINFGTAVKDLHEGNPAKDLRFVFSTGDFIDSLRVKGRVLDAVTGEPVENVAVLLYDNPADTVLRKSRPFYFSRTDKTGVYEIRNVRAGQFKVAAIEDGDQNLRWDGENERLAFLDTLFRVQDSTNTLLQLRLFKNQSKHRLIEKNAGSFGLVKLKSSATTDSMSVRIDAPPALRIRQEQSPDSLLIWYDLPEAQPWQVLVNDDTLVVKSLSREDFLKQHRLSLADTPPGAAGKKLQNTSTAQPIKTLQQNPGKAAYFNFNYPIESFDPSKWILTVDTLPLGGFTLSADSARPRQIRFDYAWQGGKNYRLEMLPGAVTDFWGQTNTDTLRRQLNVPGEKQLGSLVLNLEQLQPGKNYILQLLSGAQVEETRVFQADSDTKKWVFNQLVIGNYTAKLIEDTLPNGRWDTGDYWKKRQPELQFNKKIEGLRANWELEVSFRVNAGEEGEKKKKK